MDTTTGSITPFSVTPVNRNPYTRLKTVIVRYREFPEIQVVLKPFSPISRFQVRPTPIRSVNSRLTMRIFRSIFYRFLGSIRLNLPDFPITPR